MKKQIGFVLAATAFVTAFCTPAFAEGWKSLDAGNGWTYEKSDGTDAKNEWLWIDGDNDRIAECFYFDNDGKMLSNTTTPDGCKVNVNGEWVSEGSVMHCIVAASEEQAQMPWLEKRITEMMEESVCCDTVSFHCKTAR